MSRISLTLFWAILINLCFSFSEEPACSFIAGWIRDQGQSPTDPWPDPKQSITPYASKFPPKPVTWAQKYLKEICPDLTGMDLCWNDDQILIMYNNFKTIDSLFGNWLLWSINLKRFWCQYTCSPYQYYLLDSFEQINVPDVDYPCLNQTMRIGNDVACDIYNSWVKNPYVASLASGQSAQGFLEFMGTNAVQTGKVKISFEFSSDPERSYIDKMYPCDMDVNGTIDSYQVEPCTWNYCEAACKPNNANAYPLFFDGFDFIVVVIVYVSLVILSVIIFFIKRRCVGEEESSISHDEEGATGKINKSLDGSGEALLSGSSGEQTKLKINSSSLKSN